MVQVQLQLHHNQLQHLLIKHLHSEGSKEATITEENKNEKIIAITILLPGPAA